MDILQQCQTWHKNDEYQKIIDVLESIPEEDRTTEIDMELARAYNNLSNPCEPEGRRMLKNALTLMLEHREELSETHSWNFRMGYALYYLEQVDRALHYLEKALKLSPRNSPLTNSQEDIEKMIADCRGRISLPCFEKNFRERTVLAWEAFIEQEAHLRKIMDEEKCYKQHKELISQCKAILNLAFDNISFEIGFNGEKYDLILTPLGDDVKLFELVYFQKHAPKQILKRWNILVGKQPDSSYNLVHLVENEVITKSDIQIWLEKLDNNNFNLFAYSKKLLPMLRDEKEQAFQIVEDYILQLLGEISCMRYIVSLDILDTPQKEPSILLPQLLDKLTELGVNLSTDPEICLGTYASYPNKPDKSSEVNWRFDIVNGYTHCPDLVYEYLQNTHTSISNLYADGAVAGFFCYPLYNFTSENSSEQIVAFQQKLEKKLRSALTPDVCSIIGGAIGCNSGYVDFIAWDLPTTLLVARDCFNSIDILDAGCFHVFRQDAKTIPLKIKQS